MNKEEALVLLHETVKPSLGCTEPACAALCAASAAEVLHKNIQSLTLIVNPGLYKNGMSVAIPGFDQVGMDYAAALGALIGTTKDELQIFKAITPEIARKAKALVASGKVHVYADYDQKKIYARCKVTSENETAEALIRNAHTHLVMVSYNGKICFQENQMENNEKNDAEDLKTMSLDKMNQLVDSMTLSELDWLIDEALLNDHVAHYGKNHPSSVGIAATLNRHSIQSESDEMMRAVATAIESRLDGCPYSVSSSAGAGSKGLALTIPLTIAAKYAQSSHDQLAHALAFGHLVNSYINAVIGKLSAVCTCACAASTAACAALVKLWGGTEEQMGYAIRNMTGTVSGMICDGGKTGCAMKLAMATSGAYLSAKMAMNNSVLRESDGICASTPEQCISNIAQIANSGMANVDSEILNIMIKKKEHNTL